MMSIFRDIRLCAFDFDGTLVDSYSCLPDIWIKIGQRLGVSTSNALLFLREALRGEDEADKKEIFDRSHVALNALKRIGVRYDKDIRFVNGLYWSLRVKSSRVQPCAHELLRYLKEKEIAVACVSGSDGVNSFKKLRIRLSGLERYFDEIIVAGEDVKSKVEGLESLARRYKLRPSEILLIDDKPKPISEAIKAGFKTVKVDFKGPLRLGWESESTCKPKLTVGSLCELLMLV
ncbi:MAG: hypothetical protein DRJ41_00195 [Thermoprotei archaeon]|nr:MAG: hypothetical protein DRJ41_00195 [Thermoprotei archaeon]